MDKTTTAVGIKLFIYFFVTWVAISIVATNNWAWALLIAPLATSINYLLGDHFFLPNYGNNLASIADGLMAVVLLFFLGLMIGDLRPTATSLVLFGIVIAIVEYFFHPYLIRIGLVNPREEARKN
ncbi:DUF2512 family protein [Desulforamulus aquiferis]|uniref:DUF2512 family protein n=1 Tax=Desulforamulus aquiferis TaxID=1397668 RepID=A0AAW7ZA68_9FIRM|nr:DUF2512 family protein [Desulforamulus aquiferis]MDO7786529.1 DUF2512 family protein [Desulforamulus aquiferis]RYD03699.1 hypothetical protein N752_18295 [Desulforamulus aquiferis]